MKKRFRFKEKGTKFSDELISDIRYHSHMLNDCRMKVAAALERALSSEERPNYEQVVRIDKMLQMMREASDEMAIVAININEHGEGGYKPVDTPTTSETSKDIDSQHTVKEVNKDNLPFETIKVCKP